MKIFIYVVALLFPVLAFGQTESEPNGSFGTADMITLDNQNGTINASIETINDVDFFEFSVSEGEVFNVRITSVPSNIRMRMTAYLNESQIAITGGGPGEALTLNEKICSNGTISLRLEDNSFTSQSSTDSYTVTVGINNEDIYECNDQFSDATTIEVNSPVFAQINDRDDVDYFQFNLSGPGIITARVINVPAEVALTIELYDSDQNRIGIDGNGEGEPVSILKKVCDAGTYYLKLEDRSFTRGASTDLYRLTVTLDTDDIYECNDQFSDASPISLETPILAQINDFDDVDFFRVTIPEKGILSARVTNVPSATNIYLDLFDENMEEVARTSGGNGESVFVAEQVCLPGVYFVKIEDRSFSPSASEDFYQLIVSLNTDDIHECNDDNNSATVVSFCTPLTGYLNVARDKDYFEFSATNDDFVVISLTGFSDELIPRLSLIRQSDNATLETKTGNPGEDLIITRTVLDNGTYYVLVEDRSSTGFSDTPYQLEIERGQECWPVSSMQVDQLTATHLYPNPANNFLTVDLTGLGINNPTLQLLDLHGRKVLEQAMTGQVISLDLTTVPSGSYFVRVMGGNKQYAGRIVRR